MCFREAVSTVPSKSSPHLPVQSVQGQARRVQMQTFLYSSETWLSKTWNATNPFRINQIQLERASNQPRNLFCGLNVSFEKSCKKWYGSRTENIFVIYQKVHFWTKNWSDIFKRLKRVISVGYRQFELEINSFSNSNNTISCKNI